MVPISVLSNAAYSVRLCARALDQLARHIEPGTDADALDAAVSGLEAVATALRPLLANGNADAAPGVH